MDVLAGFEQVGLPKLKMVFCMNFIWLCDPTFGYQVFTDMVFFNLIMF